MFGYGRLCSGVFGVVRTVMVVRRFVAPCYWEMQTPCNGGRKVAVGCRWWHRAIQECNCRLLHAM